MKRFLQILLILTLLSLAAVQIMIHTGLLLPKEKESVCPVNAIRMVNGKAEIDSSRCIGCRRCVDGVLIPKAPTQRVEIPLSDSIDAPQSLPPEPAPVNVPNPHRTQTVTTTQAQTPPATQAYRVDPDKCIACELCVPNCPVGAITMQNGKAVIDKEKCISCGICENGNGDDFQGCPTGAISKR